MSTINARVPAMKFIAAEAVAPHVSTSKKPLNFTYPTFPSSCSTFTKPQFIWSICARSRAMSSGVRGWWRGGARWNGPNAVVDAHVLVVAQRANVFVQLERERHRLRVAVVPSVCIPIVERIGDALGDFRKDVERIELRDRALDHLRSCRCIDAQL